MPTIELSTRIAALPETLFDLSRLVELHLESTQATRETAIAGVTSGLLEQGDEVTWRARHFGRWWTMTVRMAVVDRPRHFRDEMVPRRGPFAGFTHDHWFDPDPETPGGTLMRDRFAFTLGWGPLGALAATAIVAPHLRRLLLARNVTIRRHAERGTHNMPP